jgi:cholesterol oxidase
MTGHVRFTEEMGGFLAPGAPDSAQGWLQGKALGWSLMFHLTIWVDDLDAFLADPAKTAVAVGWVDCPALGGRLNVERGVFNLFVPTPDPKLSNMRYQLWFRDGQGRPITLEGHKDIRDNPGFDVWKDTTCLFTTLRLGHVDIDMTAVVPDPSAPGATSRSSASGASSGSPGASGSSGDAVQDGEVLARGLLYIRPADFATQLTTFRGDVRSTVRFARLFVTTLWRTYRGGLPG